MNQKYFFWSELIGAAVIYGIATLLHFVYPLSGGALSILFGSVNESVWEHVKIFAAGYTAWAILELLWNKAPFKKFLVAKVFALYLLSLMMIVFYYLYTLILGKNAVWIDILSSLLFVCLAQVFSYRLTVTEKDTKRYFHEAAMLLMLYFLMFFSFTIFPPKMPLFRDPVSGGYGILPK
ncbi:MAG: hypothetical protein IJH32_11400 [Ruminococcus sp.]|nr:hypothetical protein [Ruminococcus sp.]